MKRWIMVLLLSAFVGMFTFGAYYSWQRHLTDASPACGLAWLKQEYGLDDARFAAIEAVHFSYQATCEELCARVIEAREKFDRIMLNATAMSPELELELRNLSRVKEECHRAMLSHIFEVADLMPPEKRQRYLEKASGRLFMHNHGD